MEKTQYVVCIIYVHNSNPNQLSHVPLICFFRSEYQICVAPAHPGLTCFERDLQKNFQVESFEDWS